jgi:MFS family permease
MVAGDVDMENGEKNERLWPEGGGRRREIVTVVAASVLFWVSLYLYVPTLPTYVGTKTDNLSVVGVVLAQYGLWQTVVRLPLGIAADWWGRRKPFILVGFVLSAAGALVMSNAAGVAGLTVGRAITGLAAATWVPLVAAFSSLFPAGRAIQATAALSFDGSVGRTLATSANGSLNNRGGYALAFTLAAGAAGLALLTVAPLRQRRRQPRIGSLEGVGALVTRRDVLAPSLLSAAMQYVVWAGAFGFIPVLAERLGADDVAQSILVSLYIGVSLVGNLATTAIADHVKARTLVSGSFLLAAVGLGLAAAAGSLPLVYAAQLSIGIAVGVAYPLLMGLSIRYVDDADRTIATGLHQAVYGVGMFVGPALSGVLASAMGIRPMFGVTALVCLLPVAVAGRLMDGP